MVKDNPFSISCDEQYGENKENRDNRTRKDRVTIFKAAKKNEKCPDYEGQLNIGDMKYKLVLWTRQTKYGKDYYTGYVNHSD